MIFNIDEVSKDKTKESYPTGFQRVDDLLYDIALGITCNQQLSIDNNTTLGSQSKKLQKLKPRTNLHNTINKIIEDLGVRESYEWQHEKIFTTNDGDVLEVIRYDISSGEYCFVKLNGEEIKITKRGLREFYESI